MIVGIIRWEGKILANGVYQPSIVPLETTNGSPIIASHMMFLPEPGTEPDSVTFRWRPVNLDEMREVLKKKGVPNDDAPVMYLVYRKDDVGLAFSIRYNADKQVEWVHSTAHINYVEDVLSVKSAGQA